MFEWLADPNAWIALGTLTALEIVLGIDNIIFISILVGRLPVEQRDSARRIGLGLAMITRLMLLFSITWVMGLVEPMFTAFGQEISGRDIILIGGGLFLLTKSTREIHHSMELASEDGSDTQKRKSPAYFAVLIQIALLDVVFSLDSVITAVGLVDQIGVMVVAIVLAVGIMLLASKSISDFVDNNPTIKILALSFLIMVGLMLIVEGFDVHVPKGYIYFAMAFSMTVEMINIRMRKRTAKSIRLKKSVEEEGEGQAAGSDESHSTENRPAS